MWRSSLILAFISAALVFACADRARTGAPTTTTGGDPAQAPTTARPSYSTPASPATAWTTSGGPASPGDPSGGTIVDADGGVH